MDVSNQGQSNPTSRIEGALKQAESALGSGDAPAMRGAFRELSSAFRLDVQQHGEGAVRSSPAFSAMQTMQQNLEQAYRGLTNAPIAGKPPGSR